MWKIIKLELGKSNLKMSLLIMLGGSIIAPFLTGMKTYDGYSEIVMMISMFCGLNCFRELYVKEKNNKTLKISAITPQGRGKAILAKLIISIVLPVLMFIILIFIISMLIEPQNLILEIPSIISKLLFVINFVIIGIYFMLKVFKGKWSNASEGIVAFTSVIIIKIIRDLNVTPITMLGMGAIILVILMILFKESVFKSMLSEDIV